MLADGFISCILQGSFSSKAYDVNCLDTTGAGDALWVTILAGIIKTAESIENLSARADIGPAGFRQCRWFTGRLEKRRHPGHGG